MLDLCWSGAWQHGKLATSGHATVGHHQNASAAQRTSQWPTPSQGRRSAHTSHMHTPNANTSCMPHSRRRGALFRIGPDTCKWQCRGARALLFGAAREGTEARRRAARMCFRSLPTQVSKLSKHFQHEGSLQVTSPSSSPTEAVVEGSPQRISGASQRGLVMACAKVTPLHSFWQGQRYSRTGSSVCAAARALRGMLHRMQALSNQQPGQLFACQLRCMQFHCLCCGARHGQQQRQRRQQGRQGRRLAWLLCAAVEPSSRGLLRLKSETCQVSSNDTCMHVGGCSASTVADAHAGWGGQAARG